MWFRGVLLFFLCFLAVDSLDKTEKLSRWKRGVKILNNGQQFKVMLPSVNHDFSKQVKSKNYKEIEKNVKEDFSKDPIVEMDEGLVRGFISKKKYGKYYSFNGIPYAKKPIRFQPAEPHPGWTDVLNATEVGDACLQFNKMIKVTVGSEDCLFLNVHTPTLRPKKLPVFVWIHGGEFRYGTSDPKFFGPSKLIRQGLVFVSFGYRLDAFGFLSTGTKEAPGNMGMRDTVEALKWLQRNVEKFGGDKDNICIYGISSSSTMVDLLTVSPMAKGLFAKAMTQSSLSLSYVIERNPFDRVLKTARALGIDSQDPKAIIEGLTNASAADLLKASKEAEDPTKSVVYTFLPVIEKRIDGLEPFLDEWPYDALKKGKGAGDVPLMAGVNNIEGSFVVKDVADAGSFVDSMEDKWEILILKRQNRTDEEHSKIVSAMKKFYMGAEPNPKDKVKRFLRFIGDSGIFLPTRSWLDARVNASLKSPTYFWEFAVDSALSKVIRADKLVGIKGAGHAENVPYIFETELNYENLIDDDTQLAIDRTLELISNFMKYGYPTPNQTKLLPVKWLPYGREANCLRLSSKMRLLNNPHKKRMDFLKSFDVDY